jgi:hypothetical protein
VRRQPAQQAPLRGGSSIIRATVNHRLAAGQSPQNRPTKRSSGCLRRTGSAGLRRW